jgi:hypothetical protein
MSSTQTPEIQTANNQDAKQRRKKATSRVSIGGVGFKTIEKHNHPERYDENGIRYNEKITIEEKEPTTEIITIEEKEPTTEPITESITEIITEPITEPVKIETDEEREEREQEEALILQMAQLKRKKAEREALKNIVPKRDEMIQQIEKEKQNTQQKIDVIRQKIDELNKSVDELEIIMCKCSIRMDDVRNGKMDAEIVANSGMIVEQSTKTTMEGIGMERRGRERERAQSPRRTTTSTTTAKNERPERPRSKSPNLDGARKIRPLWQIIQQPTEFKYFVFSTQEWHHAKTKRGDNITYNLGGEVSGCKKLSAWIDTLEKHHNGGINKRKLGVYEMKKDSVFYLHVKSGEWRRMADDVDEHTVIFNPK